MGSVRQLEYYQIGEEDPDTWSVAALAFEGMAPDEYGVELENETVQLDKYTGEIDDVYVDIVGQTLTGSMGLQVWPDNVSRLLEIAGIPRQADYNLKSYTVQYYDFPKGEYLQQVGLRANSVDITASGSSPKLMFNFDMIGKTETVIGEFAKPSLPSQPSFEMCDATFTIGGGEEVNVSEFSISINNNLVPSEVKDSVRGIRWVDAGRRQIEVTFTVRTDSTMAAHYRNLIKTRDRNLSFVVVFDYPGTGSPIDTLTITLGSLVLKSVARTGGVGDLQTLAITAVARKPAATASIVAAVA